MGKEPLRTTSFSELRGKDEKPWCFECGLSEPHQDEGFEGDMYDTVVPHIFDGDKLTRFRFADEN